MNYPVYYQGSIFPKSQLKLTFLSPCFQYGITPFDTIACIKSLDKTFLFRPYEHISRLRRSCDSLDIQINESDHDIMASLKNYLKLIRPTTSVVVRIMAFTENGSWSSKSICADLVYSAYCADNYNINSSSSPLALATSPYGFRPNKDVHDFSIKVGANYLSARYATIDAIKRGFDGALLLDSNSNVSELGGANIFFVKDHALFTPQLSSNILDGVTRDSIIKYSINSLGLEVFELDISAQDIPKYDFAFACGTTMLVKEISRINDISFESSLYDRHALNHLMLSFRLLLTGSIAFDTSWHYSI